MDLLCKFYTASDEGTKPGSKANNYPFHRPKDSLTTESPDLSSVGWVVLNYIIGNKYFEGELSFPVCGRACVSCKLEAFLESKTNILAKGVMAGNHIVVSSLLL